MQLHQPLIGTPPSIWHFISAYFLIISIRTPDEKSSLIVWMRNFHPPTIALAAFVKHNFMACAAQSISINQKIRRIMGGMIVVPADASVHKIPHHLSHQIPRTGIRFPRFSSIKQGRRKLIRNPRITRNPRRLFSIQSIGRCQFCTRSITPANGIHIKLQHMSTA